MEQNPNNLKSKLEGLRCENAAHIWFIPAKRLNEALTRETIRGALEIAEIEYFRLDELTDHVLKTNLKVFSVLVLIEQVVAIPQCAELPECVDARLPFEMNLLASMLPAKAAQEFEERQYEVIAPIFSRSTIHRSFQYQTILPFVKDERIGEGGFDTVYEIQLSHDHQNPEEAFQRKGRVGLQFLTLRA